MIVDLSGDILFQLQAIIFALLLTGALFGALIFLAYLLIIWWKYHRREEAALGAVLLQIAVPRDNEIKIDAAEQFFASLASITKSGFLPFLTIQDHVSFEIVATPGDIRFYVAVPSQLRDMLEKQIHGTYPGAEIKEVEEYNIFTESGKVAFTSLVTKGSAYQQIKVFKDLPVDPLNSLTSALAKMQEGEGAVIQILVAPSVSKWKDKGRAYIAATKKREADPEKAKYAVDPKTLEIIGNKVSKPGFDVVIRVVVSSTSMEAAKMHLSNITSTFSQFSSEHNSFTKAKMWFKGLFMLNFIYRYFPISDFPHRQTSILSSEELATIFHFPNKFVETPGIYVLNAKRAPAPASIPASGLYLGRSVYRGLGKPIYVSRDDRRRHMYIIGKTGTGKSEFLKDMVLQDIRAGEGLAVIDPHGDLVEKILLLMPPERAEDVIYFDPADTERPMGLNLLEAYTEEQKHFVSTAIIGLMYKLYDPMKTGIIGPRFEHAVRNAMLTVMSEPGSTFIEVVRVLSDPSYVQELLPKVQDPVVRRYWTDQIAQTSDFHKSEVLDYIVSKFGRFVTNKMIRNIIGQSNSSFDFRKVMDEGKILLINLSKGRVGEENSNFLGLNLVPKVLIAAMSRSDVSEEERRDFFLYVDEFQNFATPDFAQILSEARKYRLNLIVANQFIGQMEEEVKNAVFGNVGTLVTFRVGVTDANYLQHEFQPVFSEADLINVERFNAYMKTIVSSEPVPPFSVNMVRDMSKEKRLENVKVSEAIKQLSRLKFGRDKAIVEAEIIERARL